MKTNTMYILKVGLILVLVVSAIQAGKSPMPAAAAAGQLASTSAFIFNPFSTPDWTAESDNPGVTFGISVASAGDVNGDGYSDVIVGAPYYTNGQNHEGRAYVYHGSASGLQAIPAWTFESNLADCELGNSVASAGDVNGDHYDDVLVASEFCGVVDREGRVYLFLGTASGLANTYAWMIEGVGSDESLGWSIASAGDVNGDSFSDVIVGAPWASYPEGHEGRAYVFYGSASGLPATANWVVESNLSWSDFGVSVSSAGDVNGDGFSDVIIGHNISSPEAEEGRVFVYYGSSAGLATTPAWTYENNLAGTKLGESVASAGDVNGDGFSDVIVGGFTYANPEVKEGIAYLFLGSASGMSTEPTWNIESNQAYAEYGQSVASAGDVNDDGFTDVLVGAPWFSNGQDYEGRVFLYYGSSTGLMLSPVFTVESNQAGAHLGYFAASAGDVNGDGIADIIVGAKDYDAGQENEGQATVFHGIADAVNQIFIPLTMMQD